MCGINCQNTTLRKTPLLWGTSMIFHIHSTYPFEALWYQSKIQLMYHFVIMSKTLESHPISEPMDYVHTINILNINHIIYPVINLNMLICA
jgi:hypothetical protein